MLIYKDFSDEIDKSINEWFLMLRKCVNISDVFLMYVLKGKLKQCKRTAC